MFLGKRGPFMEYNQVDKLPRGFSPSKKSKNSGSNKY